MPAPVADTIVLGALNSVEGHVVSVPNHKDIREKIRASIDDVEVHKDGALVLDNEIKAGISNGDDDHDNGSDNNDAIIVTGADAAQHLLSLRDDGDPALTFRSLLLASGLSAFQAVVSQIYTVSRYRCLDVDSDDLLAQSPYLSLGTSADPNLVQTDHDHHPRDIYRSYRLLCRQSMGQLSPSW